MCLRAVCLADPNLTHKYFQAMLQMYRSPFFLVVLIILLLETISCTSTKKVIYLNDLPDSTVGSLKGAQQNFEAPIQKNDQLSISIAGTNLDDLAILNSAGGGATTSSSSSSSSQASSGQGSASGYLVEADGTIKMPFIGKLKVEGLTRLELESKLTELFKEYTKNPVVNVRFLNYSFSVMGEVNSKGRFTMANERTTILEALTMAGDLTEFGKRQNILIIREENGERNFARVNILSKDIFSSPYFYLKTNDVVYVEPEKSKFISRKGVPQYLALAAGALSLLITVINVTQ